MAQVPFPRWAELGTPGEIEARLTAEGVDPDLARPVAAAFAGLFMEHAREEEANYEAITTDAEPVQWVRFTGSESAVADSTWTEIDLSLSEEQGYTGTWPQTPLSGIVTVEVDVDAGSATADEVEVWFNRELFFTYTDEMHPQVDGNRFATSFPVLAEEDFSVRVRQASGSSQDVDVVGTLVLHPRTVEPEEAGAPT